MWFRPDARCSFRKASTGALFSGGSALTVASSRPAAAVHAVHRDELGELDLTQGPHQVAQTLTRRSFLESFAARALSPAASMGVSATASGVPFLLAPSASQLFLSAHLVEQPKTFVFSTGTGLPARRASIALRASCDRDLGLVLAVVDAADEAQLALLVEDEHVGRGRGRRRRARPPASRRRRGRGT